jgi:hypothetical protein
MLLARHPQRNYRWNSINAQDSLRLLSSRINQVYVTGEERKEGGKEGVKEEDK